MVNIPNRLKAELQTGAVFDAPRSVFTLAFSLQPSAFAPLVDNRPPV
jgi:hypothetical protein